ncbi:MAG: hypothetical protein JWO72_1370 [Caulobacteraceae bacterium]|nr:hypothetical protein [Caulobacteraceae bacterium]
MSALSRVKRFAVVGVWSLALACGLIAVCLAVSRQGVFLATGMDADILLASSLAWDVSHHAYAWQGFQLPRIPSLFPDLLLQLASSAIAPSDRWALFGYMVSQFLAMVVAAGWLARLLTGVSLLRTTTVSLVVLSAVVLGDSTLPGLTALTMDYFQPCVHIGPYVAALFGAGLASRLAMRWATGEAALFFALSTLALLSDKLLLVSYAVPTIAAIFATSIATWRKIPPRSLMLTGVLVAGAASASALDSLLNRQPDLQPDLTLALARAQRFVGETAHYGLDHDITTALFVLLPLAIFAVYLKWPWSIGGWDDDAGTKEDRARLFGLQVAPAVVFLWVFAAVALGGVLAATAFLAYDGPTSYRYLVPVFLWPLVFGIAALSARPPLRIIAYVGGAGLLAFILVGLVQSPDIRPGVVTWRDATADCLTAQQKPLGLKAGFADYWVSRPAMMASGWRLQVNQATWNGHPYLWGNDRSWYDKDFLDPSRPPAYNFLVLTDLNADALRARYGNPDRVYRCGGRGPTLWIYADSGRMTRTFLSDFASLTSIDKLRPQDATLQGGRWYIGGGPQEVKAVWGPYVDLKRGSYNLSVTFQPASQADCMTFVRQMEAAVAINYQGQKKTISRKSPLVLRPAGNAACAQTASAPFRLEQDTAGIQTPIWVNTRVPVLLTAYSISTSN